MASFKELGEEEHKNVLEFINSRNDLRDVDIAKEWRLILTESEILQLVDNCATFINKEFVGNDIVIVAILKGAVWFFSDLTKKLTIPYSTYFVQASSYKNKQTQSETVEITSIIEPSKFDGKRVILIDELYDNGVTMEELKKKICETTTVKYEHIFTCALFKKCKDDDHAYPGRLDLYGTEVPNVWLVGYGLDDNQEKRGWPHLFAVPKALGLQKTPDDIKIFGE